MEELGDFWEKLQLNEEENVPIELVSKGNERQCDLGGRSLVGKIFIDRQIGKEVVSKTMEKVWKVSRPVAFQEFRSNCFILTFANLRDRSRILDGRPWQFDGHIFVLKVFDERTQPHLIHFDTELFWVRIHNLPFANMNRQTGEVVGSSIGRVVEVDIREDDVGWGSFLRVRIECELKKVIARGRTVSLEGRSMWLPLTYENLPRLCFKCGRLVHHELGCDESGGGQFGPWLRAKRLPRGSFGRGVKRDEGVGTCEGTGGVGGVFTQEDAGPDQVGKGKESQKGSKVEGDGVDEGRKMGVMVTVIEASTRDLGVGEVGSGLGGDVVSVLEEGEGEEVLVSPRDGKKGERGGQWKRRAREKISNSTQVCGLVGHKRGLEEVGEGEVSGRGRKARREDITGKEIKELRRAEAVEQPRPSL
ncbi:uncharacterized protein LOC122305841 [Carya illinoinensis]|uniref:uncharacterized protein LOC122305841 n=1 Tax=Carya illinoinensis TaxID=32201 RepID=UPI001C720595|nr:uncharacterized protein LOC122305841 [Carya illinoinensis]